MNREESSKLVQTLEAARQTLVCINRKGTTVDALQRHIDHFGRCVNELAGIFRKADRKSFKDHQDKRI